MNLADTVILVLVIVIIGAVIFGAIKKRRIAKKSGTVSKCSGCAYKGFCGKLPKE